MAKALDAAQEKLFSLIKDDGDIMASHTLREIGAIIGISYPQGVVNKLKQLENKGYIRKNGDGRYMPLKEPIEDIYYFPLIGLAQCGNLKSVGLDEMVVQEKIPFPTKTLTIDSGGKGLDRYFFTKAKGDSMEPDIHEGDLLLIKGGKESLPSDKTLLIHNGTPKIKYLKERMGHYVLFSLNRNIDDFELSPMDEIEIIGVVKLVVSNA